MDRISKTADVLALLVQPAGNLTVNNLRQLVDTLERIKHEDKQTLTAVFAGIGPTF